MRVLFTCGAGLGHFHPLVPIARALEAVGHLVAFASLPSFASTVETAGFRFFPVGPGIGDLWAMAEMQEYASLTDPIARRELIRRRVSSALVPRLTLPDLLAWCESWTPELILTENYQFAGRVAAERLDIPHATLKVGDVSGYDTRHELVLAMDALRASVGLPSDPDGTMLFRYLYLVNEPDAFSTEADQLPPTTLRCRRVVFDHSGAERQPAWLRRLPPRPTVYATAGTAVNKTPGLLETFLEALRDEPVNVLLAVGRDRDPAEVGVQPDNVHVERYILQSSVLSACDLVLSHCGSGSMFAALDNGLPMVNVPVGMDQPENAARCARLKLGVTVSPVTRTADAIRGAVREVLGDPSYRANAQRMQAAMHALPSPSDVVAVLERLATDKQPFDGRRTAAATVLE